MRVTVKKQVNKTNGKGKELKWIIDCEAKPHFVFYTFILSIFGGLIIGYNLPIEWSNNILNTVLNTDCPGDDTSALVFPNSFKYNGKLKSVKKLRKISGEVLISISIEQDYASGLREIKASADTWGKNCQNRSEVYGTQCLYYVAQDWVPSDKWVLSGHESQDDKRTRQHVVRLEDVIQENGNDLKKYFVMLYHMYMQFGKSFDWFVLIPEKNYVRIDQLMSMLKKLNSTEFMYIGNQASNIGDTHCEIQSGIVLSRGLLQHLGPILNRCVKQLNSLNFEKELNLCINNITPLKCVKPENILFGSPETGIGVSGRKKKHEFSEPTLNDVSILRKSVTIKLPAISNQYYYKLHKFIQFAKANGLRVGTLAIKKDMILTENKIIGIEPVQAEELDENFPKLHFDNEDVWLNGTAAGGWLSNGSAEWIKMETFGKTHMYRLITLDSKPHRTIHGSWDDSLLQSRDLINEKEVDIQEKSVINMKTLYAGVDVTSGASYRYRVEEMKFSTKYYMGFQNFLPLEMKEDINLLKIKLAQPINQYKDPVSSERFLSQNQIEKQIKFLITLSGRPDNLRRFLTEFNKAFLTRGHNVMLQLVLFRDDEGKLPTDDEQIKNMINEIRAEYGNDRVKSKLLDGSFSRGLGLQEGMKDMEEDDLVYFCDIDLVMTHEILDRIRRNTIKGKQVYFPVFLSQYDPERSPGYVKPATTYFDVEKERGYWRYYSYGMVSLYAADFFQTKGFKLDIGGWGLEDLEFAEEVISSNIAIHRCADPGLIHIYHDKYCASDLPETQLDMCMATKVTHYADRSVLYKMWQDKNEPTKPSKATVKQIEKVQPLQSQNKQDTGIEFIQVEPTPKTKSGLDLEIIIEQSKTVAVVDKEVGSKQALNADKKHQDVTIKKEAVKHKSKEKKSKLTLDAKINAVSNKKVPVEGKEVATKKTMVENKEENVKIIQDMKVAVPKSKSKENKLPDTKNNT